MRVHGVGFPPLRSSLFCSFGRAEADADADPDPDTDTDADAGTDTDTDDTEADAKAEADAEEKVRATFISGDEVRCEAPGWAAQHGQSAPLAVPELAPSASSARAWRPVQLGTPRVKTSRWAPSHRLGGSSELPPKDFCRFHRL